MIAGLDAWPSANATPAVRASAVVALRNLVIRVIKLSQFVVGGPHVRAVPDLKPAKAAGVISIMRKLGNVVPERSTDSYGSGDLGHVLSTRCRVMGRGNRNFHADRGCAVRVVVATRAELRESGAGIKREGSRVIIRDV